jgi:SPP1 family predicted phage head-tail adaptor
MPLPKKASTGTRYLSASQYNSYATFVQPNAGQETDGTPLPETTVASNVHANVSMWRGRESDKQQTRNAVASYKIVVRYPKTFSVDAGMNILVRGQRHNIDSFLDPDGQRVEMHIYTWVENDTVSNS